MALKSRERIQEEYRRIVNVYDICFGMFCLFMSGVALFYALRGEVSWLTFVLITSFLVVNLVLSQVSLRAQNSFPVEIFRIFFMNGPLAALAFWYSNGELVNYSLPYIIMCIAGGVFFTSWTQRRVWGYLQMLLWLVSLTSVNYFKPEPMDWSRLLMVAAMVVMLTSLFIELVRTLHKSIDKENEIKTQLIQVSKMTALGEMAGGVAHEINTPLSIISMRAEQLGECVKEGSYDASVFAEALTVIQKTTDRIAKIVSGLRFFARDGKRAAPQGSSLAALVDDTLSFCRERFSQHGVQLEILKCPSYETLQIECRAVEISQVILNLLNNAFDAVQDLAEKWVHVEVSDRGDFVELNIIDSGNGIPQNIQEKMMQPFYTTKSVGKGTGLGLSISKGVVEAHHGKLYIDNTCPHTKFTILLPKKHDPLFAERIFTEAA